MSEARLRALEDNAAIEALLNRYADSVDRRDAAALAACFTADAEASFAGIVTSGGGEAIAGFLLSTLGPAASTHVVSNALIELDGDRASVRSRAVVYGVRGEPEQLRLRGVTYDDSLVRTAEGWRIHRRVHSAQWEGGAAHLPLTKIQPK